MTVSQPFRAESSFAGKGYSARKPFPFHVCTMEADGSGNKRLTEKSEQKTKEEQHTASRLLPVRMLSSILWEGCFLKAG